MKEINIDISKQTSNQVNKYLNYDFDYVIMVCDNAKETCPIFPNAKKIIHWSIEDPAEFEGSKEDRLKVFRKIRDQIKDKIWNFIKVSS
jgi:arsenate reductase